MAKFCTACGSYLEEEPGTCPSCGAIMAAAPQEIAVMPEVEHYVPDKGIVQMFFRHDNRLNRQRYHQRGIALVVTLQIIFFLLFFVCPEIGIRPPFYLMAFFFIPAVVANGMLAIRRLHDLDRSGWCGLLLLIPLVNVVIGYEMSYDKGTDGPNRYGPDPLEGEE